MDDVVDALCRALGRLSKRAGGSVYDIVNIGAGRPITVNELVARLGAAMGVEPSVKRLPVQPGDVPRTWADIGRARAVLGYEPRVPIEEGLRRFVAWFREQDERAPLS